MKKAMCIIVAVCMLVLGEPVMSHAEESVELNADVKNELVTTGNMIKNADGSYMFEMTRETNANIMRSNEKTYETVSCTIIPISDEGRNNLESYVIEARGGGSKTIYDSDVAGCITAHSTINWKSMTQNGREYVYLTSVSGYYDAEGHGSVISSGVTVQSQTVRIGQIGYTTAGRYEGSNNVSYSLDRSVRSYSYNVSGWNPVESMSNTSVMGSTYTITLKRGTSTWDCVVQCNY